MEMESKEKIKVLGKTLRNELIHNFNVIYQTVSRKQIIMFVCNVKILYPAVRLQI